MKIEIWSDVMCPFCYLGKRKLESALEQFDAKDEVEIIWKSFQLNPDMKTEPGKSINTYLAEKKGWSLEQTRQTHERLTKAAAELGLLYDFDKAVGLDKDDVGLPTLVFQAMIQDGRVTPGAQRGLAFLPAGQIESSELNSYACLNDDPTNLAVVFRSN